MVVRTLYGTHNLEEDRGMACRMSFLVETMKPTYEELEAFAKWAQQKQPEALAIMEKHRFILDNLDDPMQKLAFTFYTSLVEIEMKARHMFEDE